jgi:hypothetical protein
VVLRTSSLVQVKSQDYLAPQTINFFWSYVSVKVRAFFRSRFRGKQCWRQARRGDGDTRTTGSLLVLVRDVTNVTNVTTTTVVPIRAKLETLVAPNVTCRILNYLGNDFGGRGIYIFRNGYTSKRFKSSAGFFLLLVRHRTVPYRQGSLATSQNGRLRRPATY